MKRLLCLLMMIALLLSFVACGDDKDKSEQKTDADLIEERIDAFLSAYNSGDMDGVIACMDKKSGNELRAAMNVIGALGGALLGVNLSLSDLFSLGIGMSDDDYMKLEISKIEINGTVAVATTKTSLYPNDNSEIIYFVLIYENDGWYINDMTDDKPDGVTDETVNIEESLDSIDKSFLSNTIASEGLTYELSEDKTHYILTDLGTCEDDHIVIPEYPSEYNPLPIKEIQCHFGDCSYITIPGSVEVICDRFDDNVKAINYLGDLTDFCKIKFTSDGWNGYDKERFNDKILFLNGTALVGKLIIPSTVESIHDYLFSGYDKITSLNISGNTALGTCSFYGCSSLAEVTIRSDTTIGYQAFSECSSLTSLTITGNTDIESYAFSNCEKLSNIKLGDSISAIDSNAFSGTAYSNNSSNWDKGALYVGNYICDINADVINLTVKDETVGIASDAFYSRDNLTTVTLPSSLKWIGDSAFYGTNSLSTVKYYGTAEDWNKIVVEKNNDNLTSEKIINAKNNLPLLKSILEYNGHSYAVFTHSNNWNVSKAFCESVGGHLVTFSSLGENNVVYNYMKSLGIYMAHIGMSDTEEEGVWKWVTGEEMNYTNWDENEPNGATSENYGCFWVLDTDGTWNDTSLEYYNYRYGYMSFICEWDYIDKNDNEASASAGLEYELNDEGYGYIVTGLGTCKDTEIVIPNSYNNLPVVKISHYAFRGENINSVILPQTIEEISSGAFEETKISTIHIPSVTTDISSSAFSSCSNLSSITVDENSPYFKTIDGNLYTFDYEGKMVLHTYAPGKTDETFTIPEGIAGLRANAFYGCDHLENLIIGNDVESIDIYAIEYCKNLKAVSISAKVSNIERYFLNGCHKITTITVDSNNRNYKIVDGVLYTKDQKTLVRYPSSSAETAYTVLPGVTNILEAAFEGARNLSSLTLPDSIVYIGDYVFDNCDNLLKEAINGVYYIGNWAVGVDGNIDGSSVNLVIKDGTIGIASDAISVYSDIEVSVVIPESVQFINKGAFDYNHCVSVEFDSNSSWYATNPYYPYDSVYIHINPANTSENTELLTNTYRYYNLVKQ